MSTEILAKLSNFYGSNPDFVLAGGGNTSFKTDDITYIKGSGTALATIRADEFVAMERAALAKMWTANYPANEDAREAAVLSDMMEARVKGETRRPSVETLLHDLFTQQYVLHIHPANVNGITCSRNGQAVIAELFPEAIWIEATKPGYILAKRCREEMESFKAKYGRDCRLVFLQNHGVFFADDETTELDKLVDATMAKINGRILRSPDFAPVKPADAAYQLAPVIRALYSRAIAAPAVVKLEANGEILRFCADEKSFEPLVNSFSPDHIVYCRANPLFVADPTDIEAEFAAYTTRYGYAPKVIFISGMGMYTCGKNKHEADTANVVFTDAMKIAVYTESFGGYQPLPKWLEEFIINWEVESYRQKVSLTSGGAKRLLEKVAVVTGSAQGFGLGLAEQIAAEGGYVVLADINYDGAAAAAGALNQQYKGIRAIAVKADVTDEVSVAAMINACTAEFGGIDILVNNAGIARAGSLEQMTKPIFELVTAINYTAYFLCAKYASAVMKIQRLHDPSYTADIIEINSKSGLSGSNKNFAYAGSKFGGIGLTQSFALELVEFGIKVNAICPGNFLDGPLWSDPEKGLFVQYLNAGKVPGAKTVADVRRFYESKVPMNRGCTIEDVARALFYIVEQQYETGQALPVTGGQEMLK